MITDYSEFGSPNTEWLAPETDLSNIRNLVFAPCGVVGIAYGGVLEVLEKEQALNHVENVAGASSGAFATLFVSLGYSGQQVKKALQNKDFADFMKVDNTEAMSIAKLRNLAKNGALSGHQPRLWARQIIAKRVGNPDMSFAGLELFKREARSDEPSDFFAKQAKKAIENKAELVSWLKITDPDYRYDFEPVRKPNEPDERYYARAGEELRKIALTLKSPHLIAAEVDKSAKDDLDARYSEFVFSVNETPEESLAYAVRASASYPIFFRNAHTHHYGKERAFTDGGLAMSKLGQIFDKHGIPSTQTLIIDTVYSDKEYIPKSDIKTFFDKVQDWIGSFIDTKYKYDGVKGSMRERIEAYFDKKLAQFREKPENIARSLRVDRGNVAALDFGLPKELQNYLYESAKSTTQLAVDNFKEKEPEKWAQRNSPIRNILHNVTAGAGSARGFTASR